MIAHVLDGTTRPPGRMVGIVASVGGLAALSAVLAALPADFPAPVLIVQHIAPDFRSQMAQILDRCTPLAVHEAHGGETARPGHVYVAPPDRHLLVAADGALSLSAGEKVRRSRPAGDVLFASLAASFGPDAIAVVLTGFDGDGADGVRAVKAAGGVTVAQDSDSSQEFSMPRTAIATGCIDAVLAVKNIAAYLIAEVTPNTLLAAAAA